ncbi:hypothetical protein V6N13_132819 [Hibiscus sabdariffa]|uniref:Uncharacterized protein n=1 Tax=Hibiscus sabdariffa TaxID=183260 RepID=A0ABR2PWV7_9ROSI
MVVLVCDLFFKSIGAGGIRPCSMPIGADQLSNKSEMNLESYFGWCYADASLNGSTVNVSCKLQLRRFALRDGGGSSRKPTFVSSPPSQYHEQTHCGRLPHTGSLISIWSTSDVAGDEGGSMPVLDVIASSIELPPETNSSSMNLHLHLQLL